jgi:SH3-like domain-containing protein
MRMQVPHVPFLAAGALGAMLLGAALATPAMAQLPTPPIPPGTPAPLVQQKGSPHAQRPNAPPAAKPAPAAPAPEAKGPPPPGSTEAPALSDNSAGVPVRPEDVPKGTSTGLPLPRFASLRTDEVNMRRGPGTRYPIEWVYHRRQLPVEIEREFEVWRLVEDPDGVKGWVHQATLVGRRSFIIRGRMETMLDAPHDGAAAVARLEPGVIGRLRSCAADSDWCRVQVGDHTGWLKREQFWGSFAGEAVN